MSDYTCKTQHKSISYLHSRKPNEKLILCFQLLSWLLTPSPNSRRSWCGREPTAGSRSHRCVWSHALHQQRYRLNIPIKCSPTAWKGCFSVGFKIKRTFPVACTQIYFASVISFLSSYSICPVAALSPWAAARPLSRLLNTQRKC